MTVRDRIESGALPSTLECVVTSHGAEVAASLYAGRTLHARDWSGFCRAWWGVAYVRLQAFERDAEAEEAAEDWP